MEKLIIHDKKKTGTEMNFVFVKGLGQAVIEKVPVKNVLDFYKRFRDKK
jgi:3-dehydroquinate synthetase